VVGLASTAAPAAQAGRAQSAAGPCSQPPQSYWVFNGYNQCGVLNGAKPAVFRLAKPAHITTLADYHFNLGAGAKPGTIGLEAPNGYVFGPYPAKQDPDHNWIAMLNVTVPAGLYTIIDSSPATWSQNPASGGRGFVRVFGSFVASAPPLPKPSGKKPPPSPTPAPSPTHPTCASSPPSSYLISPSRVAPGATISFLLSCAKAVSLGFQGAFAPLKVRIYDEASYRNLKFVNGYLQPISPSFPVRPPIIPSYKVVGPNDIDVTLPAGMPAGSYIPVVVYNKGEVPSQNNLVVT
jgi:hypothetical protein